MVRAFFDARVVREARREAFTGEGAGEILSGVRRARPPVASGVVTVSTRAMATIKETSAIGTIAVTNAHTRDDR
jgi:hypothetical protein